MARYQPPHDRVRLTWRQRATWHRFTLRFDTGIRRQLAIAWLEEEIDHRSRRLRQQLGLHRGEGGGDA